MTKTIQTKEFYVLTGELVRIVAEDEDEMWELLGEGCYEEVETLSEIQEVNEIELEQDDEE
jgi:hypothetical protein